VPHVIQSTSFSFANDVLKLELSPLGFSRMPESEMDLKNALKSVFKALSVLHAKGWVHRDIRWENILRDSGGKWFLIDLESANWKDKEVGEFRSKYWTSNTLDKDLYTEKSDIEVSI
jgi:serine/threonine protein kinase